MPTAENIMPPAQGGIHVENASLRYGQHLIFTNLDLTVTAGNWACLLGPTGIGKSSLLRMIAGLAGNESGGTICDSSSHPLTGQLTYMAQDDLLLPWLSLMDNLTLGTRLRDGKSGARALYPIARTLLKRVGLGDRADAKPDECSGGMRQRAALARTLMENRPVILMDEPFSALDAITRFRLQDLAAELLRGRTVLQVTHDPLEALRLGHQLYIMHGEPARIAPLPDPPGTPPRDAADPGLLELQASLIARLRSLSEPS